MKTQEYKGKTFRMEFTVADSKHKFESTRFAFIHADTMSEAIDALSEAFSVKKLRITEDVTDAYKFISVEK